jgi:hypothetical protein
MNNPFLYPYSGRIMAALPDQQPIELARFRRRMLHADIESVTRDLDPAWDTWTEYQTPKRNLISKRPKPPGYTNNDRMRLRVDANERAELEDRGIKTSYTHEYV